jgi:hypothetical protein
MKLHVEVQGGEPAPTYTEHGSFTREKRGNRSKSGTETDIL